jgi:hypothetical protein
MVQTRNTKKKIVVLEDDYDQEPEQKEEEPDFNLVRIDNHKLKFKDSTECKVFKYSSKDNKTFLKLEDISLLYDELKREFKENQIQIRGLADGWKTLKNFNTDLVDDDIMDDYFAGKIKDTTKFKSFSQLLITIGK